MVRRRLLAFVVVIAAPLGGAVLACNTILGINPAQPEPSEGGVQGNPYALSCDNYCSVVNSNCTRFSMTADDTEYLSTNVCGAICPQFERVPTGNDQVDPNEPTPMTNTLNCRIWHANAAQGGPPESHTHCPHAGPLGGNMCGSDPCREFCTLDLAFCRGDASAYDSVEDCVNACEPDAGGYAGYPYNIDPNDPEVTDLTASGNTLNCRMYHLENFLLTGLEVHCTHTSVSGNGVCVN
jgi:hypothetical protein